MRASRQSLLKIVVAPLLAGLTIAAVTGTAAASTPTLMWTGAKRVNILCNVAGGPGIDHLALSEQLCRRVLKIAAGNAPMPVATITLGDPAVLALDAVTLLVHASVTTHKQERLLAFSIRPYRTSGRGGGAVRRRSARGCNPVRERCRTRARRGARIRLVGNAAVAGAPARPAAASVN